MRNTFSVTFYARQSKVGKAGLCPIEMGITCNGSRVFINLPMKVKPEDFNRKRQPQYITSFCEETRVKVNTILGEMLSRNVPITSENLRECFRYGGVKNYTVGDMVDEYLAIRHREVLAGKITAEHYKKLVYAKEVILRYAPREKEVNFITPALVRTIYADLCIKYKKETSAGYMMRIKSIIRFAVDNGKLTINPIAGVKVEKGKPNISYLTEEELERIYNFQIENQSLANVRDAFILQASTGLSYIDLCNLRKEDIQIADDGTHYIVKNRHKTNIQYTSVILPKGVEVLKRHNYQLHIISNQKSNYMLHIIQGLCGIKTSMTTHLARRTYGTLLLNRGVRIETVSRCLGHQNVRTTQTAYAKLLNDTIINEVKGVM